MNRVKNYTLYKMGHLPIFFRNSIFLFALIDLITKMHEVKLLVEGECGYIFSFFFFSFLTEVVNVSVPQKVRGSTYVNVF
jgi:hypothetical protein